MAFNTTNGTAEEAWDEARYKAALAQLEALNDKITGLRTTIPALIAPLTRPATTKSQAFAGLKKAAVGAVSDVQGLRREWESPQLKEVFERSRTSFGQDANLEAAGEVAAWGWVDEGEAGGNKEKETGMQGVKQEAGVGG